MAQDVQNLVNDIEQTREAWLRLSLVPNLGRATINKLLVNAQLKVTELVNLSTSSLRALGLNQNQIQAIHSPHKKYLANTYQWLKQDPLHFMLCCEDKMYPLMLAELSHSPLILFGIGNPHTLSIPQISIVGSRTPTVQGKQNALSLAQKLVASGWGVTSGLAIGIDGCAHRGALLAKGKTIAVLGSAIDNIYPKRHQQLADEIITQQGAIVSEFLPGSPTRPNNFPRRNRIVSGLAHGTVIVEAAIKSGSLITARYALEQNREVFAIPGNIQNPLSKGGHFLIKQGAKLVEGENDINEEFQNLSFLQGDGDRKNIQKKPLQSLATPQLLDSVGFEATALDVVVKRSNLPIKEVLAQLLEYELRGLVAAVPGGYVKLGGE